MDESLGPLPVYAASLRAEDASELALRNAFGDERFRLRDCPKDTGVDYSLELNQGGKHSNFKSELQLKSVASRPENVDGSISFSIEAKNLNYLLHGNTPALYVLFIADRKELRYEWARDIKARLDESNPDWMSQRTISVRFHKRIDQGQLDAIYENIFNSCREMLAYIGGPATPSIPTLCGYEDGDPSRIALSHRSFLFCNLGRFDDIESELVGYQSQWQSVHDQAELWALLSYVSRRRGDLDQALHRIECALACEVSARFHLAKSIICELSGQSIRAGNAMAEAMRINATNPWVVIHQARLSLLAREPIAALNLLRRHRSSLRSQPGLLYDFHSLLAHIFACLNRSRFALYHFREAGLAEPSLRPVIVVEQALLEADIAHDFGEHDRLSRAEALVEEATRCLADGTLMRLVQESKAVDEYAHRLLIAKMNLNIYSGNSPEAATIVPTGLDPTTALDRYNIATAVGTVTGEMPSLAIVKDAAEESPNDTVGANYAFSVLTRALNGNAAKGEAVLALDAFQVRYPCSLWIPLVEACRCLLTEEIGHGIERLKRIYSSNRAPLNIRANALQFSVVALAKQGRHEEALQLVRDTSQEPYACFQALSAGLQIARHANTSGRPDYSAWGVARELLEGLKFLQERSMMRRHIADPHSGYCIAYFAFRMAHAAGEGEHCLALLDEIKSNLNHAMAAEFDRGLADALRS